MIKRADKISLIRKKISNNICVIGTWQQIPNASISEILGNACYDWIALDMEHGSISTNQLPDLFRAIDLSETLPLVRVSDSKIKECKQALDAGAGGVIVPMIQRAEQLIDIKKACCWPPKGNRGVGFSRANLFGKYFNDYKKEAQAPILVAQIEHINAIKNLEEILLVKGLDAIIIGPYDLSASMGLTGEFNHPKFIKVINNIINLCKKHNIAAGDHIVHPDSTLLEDRINQGFKFIAYGTDGVFLNTSSLNPLNNKKKK